MDETGAYHRQMVRQTAELGGRIITPLMRLQDPDYTRILLVTLAETTPVSQASALQDDPRRAHIEPYAWIINKSLLAAGARAVSGAFGKGDAVIVRDLAGHEIGRGLSRYDIDETRRILGLRSDAIEAAIGYGGGPLVHADDMALAQPRRENA